MTHLTVAAADTSQPTGGPPTAAELAARILLGVAILPGWRRPVKRGLARSTHYLETTPARAPVNHKRSPDHV
jgi:hypothetical protein